MIGPVAGRGSGWATQSTRTSVTAPARASPRTRPALSKAALGRDDIGKAENHGIAVLLEDPRSADLAVGHPGPARVLGEVADVALDADPDALLGWAPMLCNAGDDGSDDPVHDQLIDRAKQCLAVGELFVERAGRDARFGVQAFDGRLRPALGAEQREPGRCQPRTPVGPALVHRPPAVHPACFAHGLQALCNKQVCRAGDTRPKRNSHRVAGSPIRRLGVLRLLTAVVLPPPPGRSQQTPGSENAGVAPATPFGCSAVSVQRSRVHGATGSGCEATGGEVELRLRHSAEPPELAQLRSGRCL